PRLWDERIYPILRRSRFLLIVLTPSLAEAGPDDQPNWALREVAAFRDLPQGSNILLAAGRDPLVIPDAIARRDAEPGWIDFRLPRRPLWSAVTRRGLLREKLTAIAVPPLGLRDDEIATFNGLTEREKRRRAWIARSVTTAVLLLVSALALVAW